MPELPEVELARRQLVRWVRGARITGARSPDAKLTKPKAGAPFTRALVGRTVTAVDRRGKWLRLMTDDGTRLFLHLGMTGDFERLEPGAPAPRFERARLELSRRGKASVVAYVDARRLGHLVVSREDTKTWSKLGPDPLIDGVDVDALHARLARRKGKTIKEVLLDQTVIAGVGNIQAAEALWRAKIDPRSRADRLTHAHVAALVRAIDWSIARTLADLEAGGARYSERPKGDPAPPFVVYGRKGEPCRRCRAALERIELGGRTTTFCPRCQARIA